LELELELDLGSTITSPVAGCAKVRAFFKLDNNLPGNRCMAF